MIDPAHGVVIVGGGLAGLTLALEIAEQCPASIRVVVLEQRTRYERDRTWSYWRDNIVPEQHRFVHLERQQWRHWRVSAGQKCAVQQGEKLYCSIDADAVYSEALRGLASCSNVSVQLGVTVAEVTSGPKPVVRLTDGTRIDAKLVFDARPLPLTHPSALCQSFTGWEIEFVNPVLETATIDLMDFMRDERGLHFFYVLPYSTRRAMIETTWVSPRSLRTDHAAQLTSYIANRWPDQPYTTHFVERGCLPLVRPDVARASGVVPIGARAGTLRAATGYAFLNTLQDCRRLARQLAKGELAPTAFAASPLDSWMDQVFLRALTDRWLDGPDWFLGMFSGSSGDDMSAFLTGRASLVQRISIAKKLPIAVFLKAAFGGTEAHAVRAVSAH